MFAIFSRVTRYAFAATIRNTMLAIASSGKVRKVISASWTSSSSRITTTPSSVSVLGEQRHDPVRDEAVERRHVVGQREISTSAGGA